MFAVNGTEIVVLGAWVIGVCAAIFAWSLLTSARQRLALLIIAVAVPVLGSVAAIATAIALRARRHRQGSAVGA